MAISSATRKRLWARSGNRCALCRKELIRDDVGDLAGALIGEEAHIVGRSPGGPRYQPLDVETRDGYANLILLCANDHTEVDAQAARYTVECLQNIKRRHELWVATRLDSGAPADDSGATLAVVMRSGGEIWDLMQGAMAYQCGSPEDLFGEEAELVDDALQSFVDWGEISADVAVQGFRAIREGKRALQSAIDDLAKAGFVVLVGERAGRWGGGSLTGKIAVVEVVRAADLESLKASVPQRSDD